MNYMRNDSGSTLIELIVSLVVLSILISAFLGIQLSFAKYNQISSTYFEAGIYANNIYEMAKGMSFDEIVDLSASGEIWNNETKFVITAERFLLNHQLENYDFIDLVLIAKPDKRYISYVYCDSIHDCLSVQGDGNADIKLCFDSSYYTIIFNDPSESHELQSQFIASSQKQILNVYIIYDSNTDQDQEIYLCIENQPITNFNIYIYESPFYPISTYIKYSDQIISTKQLIKSMNIDRIFIYPRKTERILKIPIYLTITAFQDSFGNNPVCKRQGIIWITP